MEDKNINEKNNVNLNQLELWPEDIKYIYESPDGGKTIYRRRMGNNQRELIKIDKNKINFDCGFVCDIKHKTKIEAALCEALNEWKYASQYKGDYLQEKHEDLKRIAELRRYLNN